MSKYELQPKWNKVSGSWPPHLRIPWMLRFVLSPDNSRLLDRLMDGWTHWAHSSHGWEHSSSRTDKQDKYLRPPHGHTRAHTETQTVKSNMKVLDSYVIFKLEKRKKKKRALQACLLCDKRVFPRHCCFFRVPISVMTCSVCRHARNHFQARFSCAGAVHADPRGSLRGLAAVVGMSSWIRESLDMPAWYTVCVRACPGHYVHILRQPGDHSCRVTEEDISMYGAAECWMESGHLFLLELSMYVGRTLFFKNNL